MRDSDRAYDALIDKLAHGELRCGQAINDEWLQEDLGVGKTPLREALFRLVQDGYLTAVPHKGMFVTSFDISQLDSLLSLRIILSDFFAKQLISNAHDRDIDRCEQELNAYLAEHNDVSVDTATRVDARFHEMIRGLCGDAILADVLKKLEFMSSMALVKHSTHFYVNRENTARVRDGYTEIFRALRARDEAVLSAALKKHVPKYVLQYG